MNGILFHSPPRREGQRKGENSVLQFDIAVIPGEPKEFGGDPESRRMMGRRIILDLPPPWAGDDNFLPSPTRGMVLRAKVRCPALQVREAQLNKKRVG
jgi:hypothetical protein